MPCIRYIIHIHSGFQPSAEGVALFSQRFASLRIGLNYYALSGLFFNCSLSIVMRGTRQIMYPA